MPIMVKMERRRSRASASQLCRMSSFSRMWHSCHPEPALVPQRGTWASRETCRAVPDATTRDWLAFLICYLLLAQTLDGTERGGTLRRIHSSAHGDQPQRQQRCDDGQRRDHRMRHDIGQVHVADQQANSQAEAETESSTQQHERGRLGKELVAYIAGRRA